LWVALLFDNAAYFILTLFKIWIFFAFFLHNPISLQQLMTSMKQIIRLITLSIFSFSLFTGNAQRVRVSAALGASAYYGDLIQGTPVFKEISPAFTLGGSYDLLEQLRLRLNMTVLGISGDDQYNKNPIYRARNLSFKSTVWDWNVAAEYDIVNSNDFSLIPYVFAGPGVFHFNPYTTYQDQKIYLQQVGTEGQGLAAYPDRKPYSLTQFNIGFGGGVRYELNENLTVGAELFIRKTFTDYLDDVSNRSYIDVNDPTLFPTPSWAQILAYRGGELPGGKTFAATGTSMPRGNPDNKDWFYSFQIKFTLKLPDVHWGGDLDFYGSGGSSGRGSVRNPRTVL
jgi:opacity protein-like surface antigen